MRLATLILTLSALLWVIASPGQAQTPQEAPPDTVTIDGMSHWFGPVIFTHGDHAELADSCLDCHHHSDDPTDINSCDSCHSEAFDPTEPETPQLKMAYHQRCIGCHQTEEAGAMACIECHVRAALPVGPGLGEARVPD